MHKNMKRVICPDCIAETSASADAHGRMSVRVVTDPRASLRHCNTSIHRKTVINSANQAAVLWLTEREQKTNESWIDAYVRCYSTLGEMKIVEQSSDTTILMEQPVDQ